MHFLSLDPNVVCDIEEKLCDPVRSRSPQGLHLLAMLHADCPHLYLQRAALSRQWVLCTHR